MVLITTKLDEFGKPIDIMNFSIFYDSELAHKHINDKNNDHNGYVEIDDTVIRNNNGWEQYLKSKEGIELVFRKTIRF